MRSTRRLERLENRIPKVENITLIDRNGHEVKPSRIVRMPSRTREGLCVDSQGKVRRITPLFSVSDIIFGTAEAKVESKDVGTIEDTLFLRVNNTRCGG